MKVISLSKKFIAIKVNLEDRKFYIELGKYLEENKDYKFEKEEKDFRYTRPQEELVLIFGNNKVIAENNHYILIDEEMKSVSYLCEEEFSNMFIELKEE